MFPAQLVPPLPVQLVAPVVVQAMLELEPGPIKAGVAVKLTIGGLTVTEVETGPTVPPRPVQVRE